MSDANAKIPPESTPDADAKPRRRRVSRQPVKRARASLEFLADHGRLDGPNGRGANAGSALWPR